MNDFRFQQRKKHTKMKLFATSESFQDQKLPMYSVPFASPTPLVAVIGHPIHVVAEMQFLKCEISYLTTPS